MATSLRIPHGPLGDGTSYLNFLDDPPLPVCILLAALIADQSVPARVDRRGCEITTPLALSEFFNRADAAVIERWMKAHLAPNQICDECGIRMAHDVPLEEWGDLESRHIFAMTDSGVKSYFVCDWCYEHLGDSGEDEGLPNIMSNLSMLDNAA